MHSMLTMSVKAKVTQLQCHVEVVFGQLSKIVLREDEHVLGLDAAVGNAIRVKVVQTLGYLLGQGEEIAHVTDT